MAFLNDITINMKTKIISLTFSVVLLTQSCVTLYKSQPLTLEEAHKEQIKTKVLLKNGKALKFKKIDYDNGIYYGVKKKKVQTARTPLDQNIIDEIKVKDRALSTIINIPLVFVYLMGGGAAGYSYQFW